MGEQRLLILGHTWPEPRATAAGVRMMQLIDFFRELNWDITFACTSGKSERSVDLETLGVKFQAIQLNDDQFDEMLQHLRPNMVLFDRFMTEEQFGWRVAETLPNAIRILDTEDLHSLRIAREQAVKANRKFDLIDWFSLEQTKRELASIYRSDLSLIISRFEMKLLEEELGVPPAILHYLPFWCDPEKESIMNNPDYAEREDFVFIGNGKHKPNVDAVNYLYGEIWPGIRKLLPEARISICGAYLPDHIRALHNPKLGFHIKGYVEDAQLIMRKARVNLVPMRYGAGLKGKLLLAFENGTPSVCTAAGIEGYLKTESEDDHTFNEPGDFANEAVRLYTNKEAWLQKQEDGYRILQSGFRGNEIKDSFLEALTKLGNQLKEHRSRNFTGSMLWHHSMQSTKYLSKWISLKNQIKSPDRAT